MSAKKTINLLFFSKENFYSFKQEIIAPLYGIIMAIENNYKDTKILHNRPIISDVKDKRGNYIIIKHKNNEYSLIYHILKNSFKVKVGDIVKTGQVIALVGNSGNTNGPHIHFQVQDRFNFDNAISLKITFKNIKITKNNSTKYKRKTYIEKDYYVENNYKNLVLLI